MLLARSRGWLPLVAALASALVALCAQPGGGASSSAASTSSVGPSPDGEGREATTGHPRGYYAFQKARRPQDRPPRVRKPPYHRANVHCPERVVYGRFSPRDTLCGDLNKGFIPLNPMGQRPQGEPYPFEVIKKKTLAFLSGTLPLLRKDPNLPKVARFAGRPPPGFAGNLFAVPPGHVFDYYHRRRGRRSLASSNFTQTTDGPQGSLRDAEHEAPGQRSYQSTVQDLARSVNATFRQLCQHGSGTLCTIYSALSTARVSTAVLQTILQMLTARTPAITDKVQAGASGSSSSSSGSTTSGSSSSSGGSGSSTQSNLLNMLTYAADIINAISPDAASTTPAPPIVNRSPLTQVLSALTGATGTVSSASSPLVTMLDLMTSDSSPIKLLANVYSSTRKKSKPSDSAQQSSLENDVEGLPPTPCPSLEEYVTPTFARNYQGVWKYVVQIPHEGYLTQTVQQTKCMSSRCDFVDGGLCHESPRWVSLLVAEIFYPHAVFPTSSPQRRRAPHPAPAQPPSPFYPHPHQAPLLLQQPPPVGDFHAFQQYLHRRVGADQQQQQTLTAQKQRSQEQRPQQQQQQQQQQPSKRRSDVSPAGPRAAARSRSSSSSTSSSSKDKCDGYDHVGCYIVRMYYDWFLVNGSCKCWKPSAKHVFAGRRR
ncbi:spaetzle domain-containing protein 6 [Dermacentor variabilis]|uniref:spaetzle domain-containing protein 6 n=1 Tax=Dermacentor variabilis TaxID=34621 RepID=UPI003F5BE9AC